MTGFREWFSDFARYIRTPTAVSSDETRALREEIEFHLVETARAEVERGRPPADACRQALDRFGDLDATLHACAQPAIAARARYHWLHLGLTAALLVAVGSLGAIVWLNRASDAASPFHGDIEGRVVDEQSRPIPLAHILAVVKTWPRDGFRQQAHMATSGADGTFVIENVCPERDVYEVQLAVLAEGRVLQSTYAEKQRGPMPPAEFRLEATQPLTVKFESPAGKVLQQVEVFPFQRTDRRGVGHSVYFCSAQPVVERSDDRGRVSLPYFAPGDAATLYLRVPDGEWQTHDLVVPADGHATIIPSHDDELSNGA